MARRYSRIPRLYVDAPLEQGESVALTQPQTHYLRHVLRHKHGDTVLLFNGRDGEWRGELSGADKRLDHISLVENTRVQNAVFDLHYAFAPLKHERLDYMVQKAVEMGASRLQPVLTQHVQTTRINLERMRANAIEAAEQCDLLAVPDVAEPLSFDAMIATHDAGRLLVFCDEEAVNQSPVEALAKADASAGVSVLIGPEGGFSDGERETLLAQGNVVRLSLGPRILRADTAAVAALAVVQAALGDWR